MHRALALTNKLNDASTSIVDMSDFPSMSEIMASTIDTTDFSVYNENAPIMSTRVISYLFIPKNPMHRLMIIFTLNIYKDFFQVSILRPYDIQGKFQKNFTRILKSIFGMTFKYNYKAINDERKDQLNKYKSI